MIRRALSSLLCSALILISPGLAPYQAFAANRAGGTVQGAKTVVLPAQTINFTGTQRAGEAGPRAWDKTSVLPSLSLSPLSSSLPLTAPSSLPLASPSALPLPSATQPAAQAAKSVAAKSAAVAETLGQVGEISRAPATDAFGAGHRIQDELFGSRSRLGGPLGAVSAQGFAGALSAPGEGSTLYAKPAGKDSIAAAAEEHFGGGPIEPPSDGGDNNGGAPRGEGPENAPLALRLASFGITLAPTATLAWAIVAAGAMLPGAAIALTGLFVASMAFMTDSTPKAIRAIPGVGIGLLGAGLLASLAFTAFTWPAALMGAVAVLGGWGFVRFATEDKKGRYSSTKEILSTFVGALAAVSGVGLILLAPGGLIAGGLTMVSGVFSLALLAHLPGWVGEGIESAVRGIGMSFKDVYRVLTSIRHDTLIYARLKEYTWASIKVDSWSVLSLGLLVWLPIGAAELVQLALTGVAGLALGAARAPLMLFWGFAHKLGEKSWATRFFAGWARAQFSMQKDATFNTLAKKLVPYADSEKPWVSWPAAVVLRLLQLGWLVATVAMVPVQLVVGFFKGLKSASLPYDAKLHNPGSFRLDKDTLDRDSHSVPEPKVGQARVAKLLATGIGAVPLWLYGLPLAVGGGALGWLMLLMSAGIAAMPLMPKSARFPNVIRKLPALLMMIAGGWSIWGGATLILAGMPAWWLVATAAFALASGFGLYNLIDKVRDPKDREYRLSEPEYTLGYAGALGIATALTVQLLGLGGALGLGLTIGGLALSSFVLAHLPKWLWKGVGVALRGIPHGISSVIEVMDFGRKDTRFHRNLKAYYSAKTEKNFMWGSLFLVPWALQMTAWILDKAIGVVVGLASAAVRAPSLWLWGMAYGIHQQAVDRWHEGGEQGPRPVGKANKFWAGFNRWLIENAEGSKEKVFDPKVKTLKDQMNAMVGGKDTLDENGYEQQSVSGEGRLPTRGAFWAYAKARVVQLYWLLRTVLLLALTPLLWLPALYFGWRNAVAPEEAPKENEYGDPNSPGRVLKN